MAISDIPAPKVALILQGKVTVAPENRGTFLQHFKTIYDRVLAEPECAFFCIGEDVNEQGVFSWTEGWTKDMSWFTTEQATKSYYKPYLDATELLLTSERIIEAYTTLDSMNKVKIGLA